MSIPDLTAIRGYLGESPWQVQVFEEVASTNTLLKTMAAEGASAGTVIVADRQTGGRGRLGRSFSSPAGMGIYLSVILRPDCRPEELMHLTCAAAVYLCDAVESAVGIRPGIKWINDLVYEKRKIAGILTELSVSTYTGLTDYAVLGIGINCHQSIADFPEEIQGFAGSLSMFAENVSREKLTAAIIQSICEMDQALLKQQDQILYRYSMDCVTLDKQICITRNDERKYGTATHINYDGSLGIIGDDGTRENIQSGEVSVRGLYGYI